MKKILIASDSFLPKLDGVSIFLKRIIPNMSKEFNLTLVTPRFKGKYDPIGKIKVFRTKVSNIKIANYNVRGVILGSALYMGKISLKKAIEKLKGC